MGTPLFAGCDPDLHTLSIAYLRGGKGVPTVESILLFKTKGSRKEQAVLDMLGELEEVSPVHAYGSPHLLTAYAVESQDTSYTGRTNAARVSDIVTLSQVAGGVSLWLREAAAVRSLGILVKPSAWKGSVPKGVHQCRTLRKLGIEYTMAGGLSPYPVPKGLDDLVSGAKLNKSDWKDINDSIGLALYAREKWNLVENAKAETSARSDDSSPAPCSASVCRHEYEADGGPCIHCGQQGGFLTPNK